MHAVRRDGRTHGLCAEARRPGEDLGGGQMLYQLRGEIDGVRFHGDAVGCADAIEPRVHAVVAHAVELVRETAEGGLSQPGVAVEVEDGGGLVDEIHFRGGHAGHEGLHVGGRGEVVQRAVEGGGGAGGRVAGERGGGIGGRRGVVWKRHRECVERRMRDARWLGGSFMAMHRTAHVWYAWKARELGVPAIPHACIVSAATRMHGGKMERRCINTPPAPFISLASIASPQPTRTYPQWASSNARTNLLSPPSHLPQASNSPKLIRMQPQLLAATAAGIPIPNPSPRPPPRTRKRAAETRMQPRRHTQQAATHTPSVTLAHGRTPTPPTTPREPSCLAGSARPQTCLLSASMGTKDGRWRRISTRTRRLRGSSRR